MVKYLNISLLVALFLVTSCTKKQDFKTKILNVTVPAKVKGMDPVNASDGYSSDEVARVYEGLLEYHYLKRPYELTPNLAESMPEVSKDGKTYTFKIKKGVMFHDNKCFPNGKGRELKATDFVYSLKRLADPALSSSGWWLLDGKIVGLNKWREKALKSGSANYDEKVQGLVAIDDYTLRFHLKYPSPQFLYSLAMTYTYAVPREAVEFYGKEFLNNPVGTGPFVTNTYAQNNKIEYVKNPNYRDVFYPTEGAQGDKEAGLLENAGKKLPFVDKIIVNIQTESQPAWLSFEKGKTEYLKIPKDQFDSVVTPDKSITDSYSKKGISMEITPDLDITYIAFNHDDKLFQGEKGLLLRRAMALAYDVNESNKLFYNDRGLPAQTIIPPGIGGYDPNYKNPYAKFDLEKAKDLLKQAGYEGGKGLPEITYETVAKTISRQMSEFFEKSMEKIGIKIRVNTNTWPELTRKVRNRKAQMFGMSWIGDYPDGENFLQLLYGPNSSPGPNGSNYNNAAFNKGFDTSTVILSANERSKNYAKLAQSTSEDVAYILGIHRTSFVVKHSWLKNYKYSSFSQGDAKYMDIDLKKKKETINKL